MKHPVILSFQKLTCHLALMLILYSCIDTVPIDKVEVSKILVVNSLITPDSVFSCNISRVYSINDKSNHNIENAKVFMYDNETDELICELIHQTNGVYKGDKYPVVSKTYRLAVEAKDYPLVQGVTSIPLKDSVKNVSMAMDVGWESLLNSSYSELKFTITDTRSNNNYYEVLCSSFWCTNTDVHWDKTNIHINPTSNIILEDSIYTIQDIYGYAKYTIVDPVIEAEGLMQYNPSTLIFSDQLFNGLSHSFTTRCSFKNRKAYVFCLYALSEELYKNRRSLMQHLYERGAKGISRFDDMAGLDFSSKAIDTYSNLSGGYGIFAGYNTTLLFSKLDQNGVIQIDQTRNPYE